MVKNKVDSKKPSSQIIVTKEVAIAAAPHSGGGQFTCWMRQWLS
jgi:hypothetical protein